MPRELPDRQFSRHDFSQCFAVALRFISYRPRTVQEVRRRLARSFDNGPIDKTVDSLHELGYLDDADFSRQWISSRERRRPKGTRFLHQELRRLGVEQATIEEALEGYDEAANAYNAGLRTAERLVARGLPYKDFRRQMGNFLMRRGFGYATISDTVATLWRDLVED